MAGTLVARLEGVNNQCQRININTIRITMCTMHLIIYLTFFPMHCHFLHNNNNNFNIKVNTTQSIRIIVEF